VGGGHCAALHMHATCLGIHCHINHERTRLRCQWQKNSPIYCALIAEASVWNHASSVLQRIVLIVGPSASSLRQQTELNVEALLAAISFHDAWAYLMHNATEAALPDIGVSLPPLNNDDSASNGSSNRIKAKYSLQQFRLQTTERNQQDGHGRMQIKVTSPAPNNVIQN